VAAVLVLEAVADLAADLADAVVRAAVALVVAADLAADLAVDKAVPAARPDFASMTPEQREEMRKRFADRMRQGALAEGFGNRGGRRTRQQIRGTAFFNPRNSAFDASPFSVNGHAVEKAEYSQQRFGVSLGGPLSLGKFMPSDKSFFFVNYQGLAR
jgi:hypothetical protein